jgi:hypothetical protein
MDKLISRPALCWIILSQEWLKSGSAYLWISLFWDQLISGFALKLPEIELLPCQWR